MLYLSLVKKMKVVQYRLLRGYCTLWYREKCEVVFIIFKTWRGWRGHKDPDGKIKWFTSVDEANEEVYNLYTGCVYLRQIIEI